MDKNNLNMDTIKTQFDQIKEVRLKIKQNIAKIDDILTKKQDELLEV